MGGWRCGLVMAGLAAVSWGVMQAQAPTGDQTPQVSGGVRLGRPGPPAATGSVSGRVVCGDTALPARFATVTLIPVASVSNDSSGGLRFYGGSSGRTDLEGNFAISNAAVGDYYVTAYATGYVSATTLIQQAVSAGGDESSLLASLPQVHVNAGTTSTVNFSLTRGATIAGTLEWDDSSPAAGVQVVATTDTSSTSAARRGGFGGFPGAFGGGGGVAMTDDRGQFRLTGLAPGTYVVEAVLQAPSAEPATSGYSRGFTMMMYAPGKVRKSDAKSFTVSGGAEQGGVRFTLDLRALHTVTGTVSAVSGPAVATGMVRITDSADATLTRSSVVGPDGSFAMSYVPSGTYTLTVTGASTNASSSFGYRGSSRGSGSSSGSGASTGFQPFSETLTVTDTNVSGVAISLTPVTPQ